MFRVIYNNTSVMRYKLLICCAITVAYMYFFSPLCLPIIHRHSNPVPYCRHLADLYDGRWVLKKGLTRADVEERKRMDAEIRVANGWAASLFRNDSRCGEAYHIPGYKLQGQCDPDSSLPCCNQTTGRCGNTTEHCQCDTCTDARTSIPAELADWTPRTCRVREFTQMEVCELIDRNRVKLSFIGDSLIRQLHTTLILMLTNDFVEGSLRNGTTETDRKACRGEHQITRRECSIEIAVKSLSQLGNHTTLCKGVYKHIHVDVVQDYHADLIKSVDAKIESLLSVENSWIIGAVGFHYQLDFDAVKTRYLDKVWSKLKRSKNHWPKLLWVGLHTLKGFLRLSQLPHNINIKKYNDRVTEYWVQRNVTVIDTYPLTEGIKSYDGRHYGLGMNRLKMNVVLDVIRRYYANDDNQR